jgi:hypothetical protein
MPRSGKSHGPALIFRVTFATNLVKYLGHSLVHQDFFEARATNLQLSASASPTALIPLQSRSFFSGVVY